MSNDHQNNPFLPPGTQEPAPFAPAQESRPVPPAAATPAPSAKPTFNPKQAFEQVQSKIKDYIPSAQNPNVGSGAYDDNFARDLKLPPVVLKTKVIALILIGVLFFGLLLGILFFGGGNKIVTAGLEGVVANREIPPNRRRCGIAEKTQGCVLYIMNAERRDREARDFYDEASRVTGVPSYTIKFGNVEYATTIIRPGYIAQINIPPIDR